MFSHYWTKTDWVLCLLFGVHKTETWLYPVSRKGKVFGLKVKKKKKVNTDIVLENKGAVGTMWNTQSHNLGCIYIMQ